jgi:hypothetical protein
MAAPVFRFAILGVSSPHIQQSLSGELLKLGIRCPIR